MQMHGALLFSTGYQANIGAVSRARRPEDAIFSDDVNHASLIDGVRLSRAGCRYPQPTSASCRRSGRVQRSTKLIVNDVYQYGRRYCAAAGHARSVRAPDAWLLSTTHTASA